MRYDVYHAIWDLDRWTNPVFRKMFTLDAVSPEDAIALAKKRRIVAPIVQEVKAPQVAYEQLMGRLTGRSAS